MLTPAQKKFRRQMKELQMNGQYNPDESIYAPIKPKLEERDVSPFNRKRSLKSKTTFSIIGIILFLSIFSNIPKSLYNDYIVYKHAKIVSYLEKNMEYTQKSSQIVNTIVSTLNNPSFQNANNIRQARDTVKDLMNNSIQLDAPSEFKEHKEAFLADMEQRLVILTYLDVTRNSSTYDRNEFQSYINELKVKQELERDSLKRAFNEADIEYTELADGTIQFWYKTNDPSKAKPSSLLYK